MSTTAQDDKEPRFVVLEPVPTIEQEKEMIEKIQRKLRWWFGKPLRRLIKPRSVYLLAKSIRPISERVGADRGRPIDRYYIENFLRENATAIRGRVLEVKDDGYTRKFGQDRVNHCDVLDINTDNPHATVYGDLRNLSSVGDESYDCVILTQVLQYVDDLDAALRECRRILKPGGTLLVTVPSLGKIDGQEDNVIGHYWRLTKDSARYVFTRHFPVDHMEIRAWGNVLAGMSFWIGLAQEDLPQRKLDYVDPQFPCVVTIRATKPAETPSATTHAVVAVSILAAIQDAAVAALDFGIGELAMMV